MSDRDSDDVRMATMFRTFAEREFSVSSPLYERLSHALADRRDLTAPLLVAPPGQRGALLYFAAVGYVLRTTAIGHPLSDWMPTLGGTRAARDGDPLAALATLVRRHTDELTDLCARRTTQTNEAARAALVRPAFGRVTELFDDRPLALIELGTSAGLLLAVDRYAYRYAGATRTEVYGSGLRLHCEVRGDGWPEPAGVPIRVASRTGIDLSPIDAADASAVTWLRACIWPEHIERAARLDAALAEVRSVTPRLVTGDIVATLPDILSTVDGDVTPCVFASHALVYLDTAARTDLVRLLDAIGRTRDMAVVLNEGTPDRPNLFAADAPPPAPGVRTQVVVVTWRGGTASVEVLAEGGAHGGWISWNPRVYGYRPPALASTTG